MGALNPIIISNFSHGLPHERSGAGSDDCACPVSLPATGMPLIRQRPLRLHPDLRRLALDTEFSLLFVPSHSQVAVVNTAAVQFLSSFTTPMIATKSDRLVGEAFALGLLVDGAEDVPPDASDSLVVWLHVTNACNLRCSYCYISKSDEAMNLATGQAAIDAAIRSARAASYRRMELKYAGGEASLNMALVEQLHPYAVAQAQVYGIEVHGRVLSNGAVLTTPRLQQIRALGLDLMISLDGLEADHDRQRPTLSGRGSFKHVLAGIDRAVALDLRPHISVTISAASVAGLSQLIDLILDRDLPFSLNFVRPHDADTSAVIHHAEQQIVLGMRAAYAAIGRRPPRRSLLGSLLDRTNLGTAHQRTCGVGENYLVFDQRGQVAKCQMTLDTPITDAHALDPLAVIRADQIGVRNLPVGQKNGCRSCEWRYWCAGGCGVLTARTYGREDVASPNCAIYKALYPDVLRLEGQRLLYWWRRQADSELSSDCP